MPFNVGNLFNGDGLAITTMPIHFETRSIPRWIMASCRHFFHDRRGQFSMFFEHAGSKDLRTDAGGKIVDYFEFRLDGPFSQQHSKNETEYAVEINILCISNLKTKYTDQIEIMVGIAAASFELNIPVFRFGDQPQDDQSLVGCLKLVQGKNEQVRVSRFGQANPDTQVIQASVEGHYTMRLVL